MSQCGIREGTAMQAAPSQAAPSQPAGKAKSGIHSWVAFT